MLTTIEPAGLVAAPEFAINAAVRSIRVAMVCMPFCMAERPSIQVGLLTALARRAGFETDPIHLNLELAARIPLDYEGLCTHRGHMTGEWLFSIAAFGEEVEGDDDPYYRAFPEELAWAAQGERDAKFLSHLRHGVLPQFIEDCVHLVEWRKYDVVGFTSTFQQNVACIALAMRLKKLFPSLCIVVGGANMEGDMGLEYARAFPCIDHVVLGEGDVTFPELLRRIASQSPIKGLRGVTCRNGSGVHFDGQSPPLRDMDSLPVPVYDEYFDRRRRLGLEHRKDRVFAIPFESSRGCWWGEKHHCTFCGLNGENMMFRVKRPKQVLSELSELANRHRVTMFQATDNIVDMKYIANFFSQIEETKTDFEFFYETKANLTQDQIRALRRGGVRWLQPGIESFSTHVLQLMRKGCTMLQNVRTLKWCRYYRIRVGWNLLWGFPEEREEDYQQEYKLLKVIGHLEPPVACDRIWMERFSPVFFDHDTFTVQQRQPETSYRFAYPHYVDLEKAAYFFDYKLANTLPDEVHRPTKELVKLWTAAWNSDQVPTLVYRRTLDAVIVDDHRPSGQQGSHMYSGPMAAIYEFCSPTMHTATQVASHLEESDSQRHSEEEIRWALDEFCRRDLMIVEDGKYLSLAIPANPNL